MSFLKKIMIVDDNAEMRSLLREYLMVIFDSRIIIREFESADAAKNFALDMDVIVSDFEMENGNGIDLYNYLHESRQALIPSMILFTGKKENLISEAAPFYLGQVEKPNIDGLIEKIKLAFNM